MKATFLRFWDKVKVGPYCWEWQGRISEEGYGEFRVGGSWGHSMNAHRWIHIALNGELPTKIYVCHICGNRKCVNPKHLYAGTARQNMQDRIVAGTSGKKLNADIAREILSEYAMGVSQNTLAARYGVSQATISAITRRKTWKHV